MKKFINSLVLILFIFCLFTMTFTACGADYGKLTVYKIEDLIVGESKEIVYAFSNEKYKSDIEYSFEGNDIKIENGKVTALVGGKKVMVTAKSKYHETNFAVFTLVASKQSNIVTNEVHCWQDYPDAPLDIYFTDEDERNSAVFEYDTSALFIDEEALTVKPLRTGNFTVTLSTCYADGAQFKVISHAAPDKTASKWETGDYASRLSRAKSHGATIKEQCTEKTTLFIGDSFFDPVEFFKPYISEDIYPDKDVLICGIGTATTYFWENYLEKEIITFNKKPANIVINLGTNNIHNGIGENDGATAAESLQRLFLVLRKALPDTRFYYFSIAPRGYNTDKVQASVTECNRIMKDFCEDRKDITFIDVFEIMKDKIRGDNIHPVESAYKSVYAAELAKAGCVIADK